MNGISGRALAQDDVDGKVLHGGVENLLIGAVQPMNLIHKKDIPFVEVCQHSDQIAGLFNGGTGGNAHVDAHLICNDLCHRGLAKSRRTIEQNVIERLIAHAGGVNKNL